MSARRAIQQSISSGSGERQQADQVAECFVLLPREGIVNVSYSPDSGGHTAVQQILRQLELLSGYTAASTKLLLRGRELTEADLPTEATLQLTVRPVFRQLADDVEDGRDERSIAAWLAGWPGSGGWGGCEAARQRQLEGSGHSGESWPRIRRCWLTKRQRSIRRRRRKIRKTSNQKRWRTLPSCWPAVGRLCGTPSLASAVTPHTGRTGLHFACYHQQPRVCRLLLSRMPRDAAALRDASGRRAADYATAAASAGSEAATACRRLV
uniref:ANK_REP_REGION domain-containing protein n=1 Tax=Macrostomum lignano TaxID=282301 RepID=A0A1I8IJ78_9PLAT